MSDQASRYDVVTEFDRTHWTDRDDDGVLRAFFELVGPLAGKRSLDVAAGHGRITRELRRRGADVAGLDLSPSLIAAAEAEEGRQPLGIRY